ncbi:TAXI family TRAP transporter solute-binding subunit [Paracoccus sp. (in: a-proteobacteria)]|uniref:TAXI family TRAP transporter solute-binding subunit n=1 Tax=Paracoccus sp. TaxID=267 RepID=UPI003A87D893
MFDKIGRHIRTTLLAGTVLAVGAASLAAQPVRIGAMREGSSWYVFAAALEQMIEPILGRNSVEIIARGGGVANPMVVQIGKAEIALSNTATAVWAYEGSDLYDGMSAPDIRALVGGLNDVYIGVIAREDFLKKAGSRDLKEILQSDMPVRIVIKPVGSSAVPATRLILQSLDTSIGDIRRKGGDVVQLGTSQIADQLRNGGADIYIDTMIKGHPTITEVALTVDVAFLDLPEESQRLMARNGMTIGTYGPWFDGQTQPTIGANLGTVLIASDRLDEDTAYRITKTIIENADALKASHGAWARFDPAKAMLPEKTGIPLHPGAARYYSEAGTM